MNTKERLTEIKTKLENLKRLLELENKRLMDLRAQILVVSENEDILDEDSKQEHYNNIVMFNAWVDAYDNAVNRYNWYVELYNTSVDIQEIIDRYKD